MPQPGDLGPRREGNVSRLLALAALSAGVVLALGSTAASAASWQPIGPSGGAALGLAVDPIDPGTVYAASGAGGLFKTVDGGRSWGHSDVGLLGHNLVGVVVDPTAPATVYAVATTTFVIAAPAGVFKSTDGGTTWADASSGFGNVLFLSDLAIDPQTPTTLYAAVGNRVFKSIDGAASWSDSGAGLRLQPSVTKLAVDPLQPAVVYAGTTLGVFKSIDAGATWRPALAGIGRASIVALAVDPGAHGTVYAGARPSFGSPARGLFVSTDGGATWTARPVAADNPAVSCLVASPAADRAVFACGDGEGLFKSVDGGGHWLPIDRGLQASAFAALAIAPSSPNRLYAGVGSASNAGPAVYRTLSGGAVWRPYSAGFDAMDLSSLAVDPTQVGTVYVGTATGGVLKTTDDGGSWAPANRGLRGALAVGALAIDPLAPSTLFVETDGGFFASHNGAARWIRPGAPFPGAAPLVVDPQTPATLYSSSSPHLHAVSKSVDGGVTWQQLAIPGSEAPGVSACAVAPSAPANLYVADASGFYTDLLSSHDGGATFQSVFTVKGEIPILAVDPADPLTLYFEMSTLAGSGLFKSSHGGRRSVQVLAGNPSGTQLVYSLAIDPANPAVLYAGTVNGVLMSRDGGTTWSDLAPGLPPLPVFHLGFGPAGALYAVVQENSVYRITR